MKNGIPASSLDILISSLDIPMPSFKSKTMTEFKTKNVLNQEKKDTRKSRLSWERSFCLRCA